MRPASAILVALALAAGTFALLGAKSKAVPATPARQPAQVASSPAPRRVVAYYFHTTLRCASCRAIEANSKEAIDSAFAPELRSGRLAWKVVNIESKGNEHYAKDYKLYTKSVVLVKEVRGKQTEWKNLARVWELLQDKPAFLKYVQAETREYLEDPA